MQRCIENRRNLANVNGKQLLEEVNVSERLKRADKIEELFIRLKIPYNIYHRTSYKESEKMAKGLDPLN